VIIKEDLKSRANNRCELCGGEEGLEAVKVSPDEMGLEGSILICKTCSLLIKEPNRNPNHWRCLNSAMWSEVPAVRVMSYKILESIKDEDWSREMLEMLYLEPELMEWTVDRDGPQKDEELEVRDRNGNVLRGGDAVLIVKDLPVKGAGFTAKQGTVVKSIKLLPDDPNHIEGRVNGVKIYLKTEFLKKV
jgi:protein PhnA